MKKLNQAGFHLIPVLLFIVVIGAVGFVGYKVMNADKNKNGAGTQNSQSGDTQSFMQQYGDTCKDRSVKFTGSPVPLNQLGYIEPLGKVSDGHVTPTDHVYLAPKDPQAADNTTDVVMPADGTVVEIDRMPDQYIGDQQHQTAPEDHRLVISFSCRYFSIFIHVHRLAPALAAAAGQQEPNSQKRVALELKAGDLLGKIGGAPVDWTPIDTDHKLKGFIDPALYDSEAWKIYTVSPFELYSGSIKQQMEAKSLRTVAPLGGKIDWDLKGRLQGNWFREGTNGYAGNNKNQMGRYWDGHLSVAPNYIDGVTPIVSIGNWQGTAQQFAAKGSFDPAAVGTSTGPVKVELTGIEYVTSGGTPVDPMHPQKGMKVYTGGTVSGTILFQVEKGEKLKVEKFPGKTAAQVSGFTSAAQTYTR
jgi:hypothetical protein